MISLETSSITSIGKGLDTSPKAFGELRRSDADGDGMEALRDRMEEDGYLFLPGFWHPEDVHRARREVLSTMRGRGLLHPESTDDSPVPAANYPGNFYPEIAMASPSVRQLVFGPRMMGFWRDFFSEEPLHFDFIWQRAMMRGHGSTPHCDVVYMGRGTRRLYTTWVPHSDVPTELGGLMLLEGSHRQADRLAHYLHRDVDQYCENGPNAEAIESGERQWEWNGELARNPVTLRAKLGGRWLTTEYRAGDMVAFGMETIHGSLDNHTDRIRLSTDTRYQRASEPADERWMGAEPIGHGLAGKRGRIC